MKNRFLLLLAAAAASGAPARLALAPTQATSKSAVRDELMAVHDAWDAARTGFDGAAFERMLAPDFWVQIGPQKMTREQFIALISQRQPGALLKRFESDILTLTRSGDAWEAVVEEKLEVELTGPDGKAQTGYSLWITKDRFRKDGERWLVLSSEAVGTESWGGGATPPFDDWSS